MSPQNRHRIGLVVAGVVVVASCVGVTLALASTASDNLDDCGVISCVDHGIDGAPKDQPGLIPVTVSASATPEPVIGTAQPAPDVTEQPADQPAHEAPYVNDITEEGHPTGALEQWDEDTLECGVNAAPAIDQDEHGNWWAYCEPALVNDDGTIN